MPRDLHACVDGHLLFVRDGTLLAQPFDADAVRLTGDAKPLLEGLHYFQNTGLAAFSASRTGLLAWRVARPPVRLVWVDRTGLEVGSIGRVVVDGSGRLSPDGKRYAIGVLDPRQGVADLWIYDLARESQERITTLRYDEKSPVWAPGGSIYYRTDGAGGAPDIVKWTPGGDGHAIVYRGPGVDEPHDVAPDGRSLLFVSYADPSTMTGADINLLPLVPEGPPKPFAATPFQELSPRYSPDGRQVAYSSNVSGRPEVYVRPLAGTGAAILVSRTGGMNPRWSRDGKELFFLAPGGRVMVVQTSPDFGQPRLLFQVADAIDFEVGPDGTRFLVQMLERGHESPIHVLVNWKARLASP